MKYHILLLLFAIGCTLHAQESKPGKNEITIFGGASTNEPYNTIYDAALIQPGIPPIRHQAHLNQSFSPGFEAGIKLNHLLKEKVYASFSLGGQMIFFRNSFLAKGFKSSIPVNTGTQSAIFLEGGILRTGIFKDLLHLYGGFRLNQYLRSQSVSSKTFEDPEAYFNIETSVNPTNTVNLALVLRPDVVLHNRSGDRKVSLGVQAMLNFGRADNVRGTFYYETEDLSEHADIRGSHAHLSLIVQYYL